MSNSQMDAIDYRYLLIEHYKKLRLSENELCVLLLIQQLLQQKNTLITPDLLSMKMNLEVKEIDKIFVSLIERGLLQFHDEVVALARPVNPCGAQNDVGEPRDGLQELLGLPLALAIGRVGHRCVASQYRLIGIGLFADGTEDAQRRHEDETSGHHILGL